MTTWLEQIRPASFAGVPFQCRTHSAADSNRADVYELADTTKVQPLGRGVGRHSIEGFVSGDDAPDKARAIRAALRLGQGVLVHPIFGELTVHVESYTVSGTRDEHQRLSLSFEAVEYDPRPAAPLVDVASVVATATAALRAAAKTSFLGSFATGLDFADYLISAAEDAVGELLDTVDEVLAGVADARAAVARVRAIRADLVDLLNAPEDFADAILGLMADIADLLGLRAVMTDANTEAAADVEAFPTLSAAQADTNRIAIAELFAAGAAAAAVDTVLTWPFASWDLAQSMRTDFVDAMQAAESVAAPDLAAAYIDGRVALDAAIDSLAGDLVPLRSLSVGEPESAVLLAYRLYGDATRADDIATRNDAADPGAMYGALRVEVA